MKKSLCLLVWLMPILNLNAQPEIVNNAASPGQVYFDKGVEYLNLGGEENICLAINNFNQAISKEADLTWAYLKLVDAYLMIGPNMNIKSPEETRSQAIAAINKAVSLDPYSIDVMLGLAKVKSAFEWDWNYTEKILKMAVAVEPSQKTIMPYINFLSFRNRNQEAIQHLKSISEREEVPFIDEWIAYLEGDKGILLKHAQQQVQKNASNPYSYWSLAVNYARIGEYNKSIEALKTQIPMMGEDVVDELGLLGYNYGKIGQQNEALKILKQLNEISRKGRYVSPVIKAWIYCGLGDNNNAIQLLEDGFNTYANRCGPGMKNFDFIYASLSHESRFVDLMKKMQIEL